MAMTVDAAGQHKLAARIDLAPGGAEPAADCNDAFAGDRNIGLENIGCGGDAPSADDQVVGGRDHRSLLGNGSGKRDRAGRMTMSCNPWHSECLFPSASTQVKQ